MKVQKLRVAGASVRKPRGRGAQAVYGTLRDQILRLELAPGAKLDEAALVRDLGVSRTPLREAIVRLAAEGLVFLLPNHGAQVAPLDLTATAQYFEAFDLVQRVANHWAALRHTDADLVQIKQACKRFNDAAKRTDRAEAIKANYELHAAIAVAARNAHIEVTMRRLLENGMRLCWLWYKNFSSKQLVDDMSRSCMEHNAIVAAIEARDAAQAESLAHVHNESFRERMKEYLDNSLAPAVSVSLSRRARG
jgi:DNA-binding GntR family transcriptional regulator